MLKLPWRIPIGKDSDCALEGFANFIASKGKNEFGGNTATETDIDAKIMYDMSGLTGAEPGNFNLGLEYQYWKKKIGNNSSGPAGSGAFAKPPMIRAEYYF